MEKGAKIFIAGVAGLLGSAIVRRLEQRDYDLITPQKLDLNLLDSYAVTRFFDIMRPDYVFLVAAKVGSIFANINQPAEFLSENLGIQKNVIENAHRFGVKKLLFYGSNCMYPRECSQPMKEECFMTGPLELTNQAYAIAKITGLEMCRSFNIQYGTNFIVAIPASMYGENDNFGFGRAHVLPDLINKFHNAKTSDLSEVVLFGDGSPRREFIYVEDVADASIFLMENFNPTRKQIKPEDVCMNIGTGVEHSIAELAEIIRSVVGYRGKIFWDTSKPNGMPRKLLDSSRLRAIGWHPQVGILQGIERTYQWFIRDIGQT